MFSKIWFIQNEETKKNFFLKKGITKFGRTNSADIKLKNKKIHRKHCEIQFEGKIPVLINIGTNGTMLNNKVISFGERMKNGDKIKVIEDEFTLKNIENIKINDKITVPESDDEEITSDEKVSKSDESIILISSDSEAEDEQAEVFFPDKNGEKTDKTNEPRSEENEAIFHMKCTDEKDTNYDNFSEGKISKSNWNWESECDESDIIEQNGQQSEWDKDCVNTTPLNENTPRWSNFSNEEFKNHSIGYKSPQLEDYSATSYNKRSKSTWSAQYETSPYKSPVWSPSPMPLTPYSSTSPRMQNHSPLITASHYNWSLSSTKSRRYETSPAHPLWSPTTESNSASQKFIRKPTPYPSPYKNTNSSPETAASYQESEGTNSPWHKRFNYDWSPNESKKKATKIENISIETVAREMLHQLLELIKEKGAKTEKYNLRDNFKF